MSKPGLLRPIGITASLLFGFLALLAVGLLFFFRYMSSGELHASPQADRVTVAFSDGPDVYSVMQEVCQDFEVSPSLRLEEYHRLLSAGGLAQVPPGTPISLEERGSFGREFELSRFTFRSGPWRGKTGWTCPHSVVLFHPYP
jgi:hypothetical protein